MLEQSYIMSYSTMYARNAYLLSAHVMFLTVIDNVDVYTF